jgi:hypothetical protein
MTSFLFSFPIKSTIISCNDIKAWLCILMFFAWRIIKLSFYHNIHHNKHHILYIVIMDETTKFTSHVSWAIAFFVCKKNHSFIVVVGNEDYVCLHVSISTCGASGITMGVWWKNQISTTELSIVDTMDSTFPWSSLTSHLLHIWISMFLTRICESLY